MVTFYLGSNIFSPQGAGLCLASPCIIHALCPPVCRRARFTRFREWHRWRLTQIRKLLNTRMTKLYMETSSTDPAACQDKLESDLNVASDWLKVWNLDLITNALSFFSKCVHSICVSILQETSGDLSISISCDLRWKKHMSQVVRKMKGVLASEQNFCR